MMRLSELKGVLFQLEQIAHKRGNIDPIVELFNDELYVEVDLQAIANDPEGQLLRNGTIHLPTKEIVRRGFAITYGTDRGEDSIIIDAESKAQAEQLFKKHFSSYELKLVIEAM